MQAQTNTHRPIPVVPISIIALSILTLGSSAAAQNFRDVVIEPVKVTDSVFMLKGSGGNIGVSIGDDGVFMIDDQYAPLTGKILEAIGKLSGEPVKFLINTHWHGDHTGGNENLGGAGAIIVAHRNVYNRLSTEQFMEAFHQRVPAAPADALPVISFDDTVTFHWNDDELHAFHVPNAHTDGDVIIHFRKSNVIHMGDTYFSSGYPFIDTGSGGSITGIIRAATRVLDLCDRDTKVIPGHGELSNANELLEYRDMLVAIRNKVSAMMKDGKSKEQIIAAKPSRDYDAKWGGGFMQPDPWIGFVFDGLMADEMRHAQTHEHEAHENDGGGDKS